MQDDLHAVKTYTKGYCKNSDWPTFHHILKYNLIHDSSLSEMVCYKMGVKGFNS